jgi:hypothetical protein
LNVGPWVVVQLGASAMLWLEIIRRMFISAETGKIQGFTRFRVDRAQVFPVFPLIVASEGVHAVGECRFE